MANQIETFLKPYKKSDLPDIRPGDIIRISQKIKEGDKERVQEFEGQVIIKKHGKEMGSTITVRKIVAGVGVEKILPLHLPSIERIEVIKKNKARRAKLYYLRTARGDRAKIKERAARAMR